MNNLLKSLNLSVMKSLSLLLVMASAVLGCASNTSFELQEGTLATNDRIDVVFAQVDNPYPECENTTEIRRIANLSEKRSKRVYLQGGALCQRSH